MRALIRPRHHVNHPARLLSILSIFILVHSSAPVARARLAAQLARQSSASGGTGQGKQDSRVLVPGKSVERTLEGEQAHVYEIKLTSGQLLDAVVDQRGIDVVVTVFDPNSRKLLQVDSPNGDAGPEPVSVIVKTTGVHRLEVRALEKGVAPGRYEVKISEIRTATETDVGLEEANELERQAEALYNQRRYDEAIVLEERVLAIRERLPIPKFPLVVSSLTILSNLYDTKSDLVRAIQYAEQALPLVEKALGSEHSEVARRLNTIGVMYQAKRDYIHSEPLLRRALGISEKTEGAAHPDVVVFRLNNLALLLVDKGEYARAEPLYQRAIAMAEKMLGTEHVMIATLLANFSKLYEARGDYERAEALLQRATGIREKALGGEHRDVATLLNSLGEIYRQKGEYAKAEPLYLRALSIREKTLGAEHYEVATALSNLALLYIAAGDYARAEPLYQRARAIYEKQLGTEHPFVATVISGLAGLYNNKGDYARAEPLLRQVLSMREKALGSESQEVALALNNLAQFYLEKGEYVEAGPLYQRALTILEKVLGAKHPTVATVLNNLGGLYEREGDRARAAVLYQRALRIREETLGAEHPDVAASLNNVALFYMKHGDLVRAEPLFQRVVAIWEKSLGTKHPNYATALNNLAGLYERKGDITRAEATFRGALDIREKALGAEHIDVAASLSNLALLYQGRGDNERAEPMHQRALAIYEKSFGDQHPTVATLLSNLAELYRKKGDAAQAVKIQAHADEISERHLALLLTAGSEEQKRLYAATLSDETDYTISLHTYNLPANVEAARLAMTTILRRKGRVLDATSDQIRALRRRLAPQDLALFEQLSTARAQLAAMILKGPGKNASAAHRMGIDRLEAEVGRLEAEVSRRSTEFNVESQPVTLDRIQAAIPARAALVEIISYRPFKAKPISATDRREKPRYAAYILSKDGPPLFVDLKEASAIDANIARFRAALGDPQRNDVKTIARSLGEKVMRPIRKALGDTHQLFISPDGALNLIPFAALVDEQGQYLVENYSITYLTSGRDLLRYQVESESKQGPVVIADPLFTARRSSDTRPAADRSGGVNGRRSADMAQLKFGPLPGTADEAKAIAAILPQAKVLTQAQATEAALKEVASPRILHIATHGFFLNDRPPQTSSGSPNAAAETENGSVELRGENPLLRSGLALTGANQRLDESGGDGLITALEASGLNLWGTKLVVLSACETGVGDVRNGEGVYGLRRALVIAGAESQVMSLWKVDDTATRRLMTNYYERLQSGEGRTEALRQVQIDVLKKGERTHPFYWAGFIQSGDWRGLNGK